MRVELDKDKLYYSIGEVSEMFDVSNSLIRYWETEFRQLHPKKNNRGDRRYTPKDIRVIESIFTLVKVEGYTIEGAKKVLSEEIKAHKKNEELLKSLHKIKRNLESIKSKL